MVTISRVLLDFRSPVHFGRRGVGLNETAVALPAEGDWFGFGSAFKAYGEVLVLGLGARLAGHDATPVPLASSVARLAAWHFSRGEVVDAALAAPLYVRDKVALTTAERLASGGKA